LPTIADYNGFVSAEAAANSALAAFDAVNGVTWTAIGSTASGPFRKERNPVSEVGFKLRSIKILRQVSPL
jgi:hypothetical protein